MLSALNFNHLLYFWAVAKEGGVTAGSKRLHVSQPTVSTQIRKLETTLGAKLFDRAGGRMTLTDVGQVVFDYADEIFRRGEEIVELVRGGGDSPARGFRVGVVDALPKLVVCRLLEPAFTGRDAYELVCVEGKTNELLDRLDRHELDLVLVDAAPTSDARRDTWFHRLGSSTMSVFGTEALRDRYRRGFPGSLDGAPMLLPTRGTRLRERFEVWSEETGIRPRRLAEFEDSALMGVFGQASRGLFMAPTAIGREVQRQYRVKRVGRLDALREDFYAVNAERRLRHPAVVAIATQARERLFRDA
ncbi:MAG: transcriptional activator NhaR [Planctomycetota bacterium]